MNILITGGAGYIGSHIAESLKNSKNKIFILDNNKKNLNKINIKNRFYCDIKNKKKLEQIFKKYLFDVVIHLAAKTSVKESILKPLNYFQNNYLGSKNIVNLILKYKVKKLIFSSTAAIYKSSKNKVSEKSKKLTLNPYSHSKLLSEKYIIKKLILSKLSKYIILRYFNVVGADYKNNLGQIKNNGTLFKNLSRAILKKKSKINLYGNKFDTSDGSCVRDFIDVRDLAYIHKKILLSFNKQNKSNIFNCGYSKAYTVLQTIREFEKISKKKIFIKVHKKRKSEIVYSVADTKKLNNFIKWKPKYDSLKKMIMSSILWEKKIRLR